MSWMVLEGATQLPLCLIEAVEKVDAGDIIYKETFALDGTELIEDLRVKQGEKIVEMCIRYLQEDSLPVGVPQEGEESFYSRRTQEDSRLDVTKTIEEQFNLLRIVDNERYPAFFEYKGVRYKVTIEKDK
jgi:methionyl-tRNA formyltransferase